MSKAEPRIEYHSVNGCSWYRIDGEVHSKQDAEWLMKAVRIMNDLLAQERDRTRAALFARYSAAFSTEGHPHV